jgi:hypothetical protein
MSDEDQQVLAALRRERTALANRKFYAGTRNLCDSLTWIDDGSSTRLVWKADVEGINDLTRVANAHLAMIVEVTWEDCWIMADAAWRGPIDAAQSFSDIRLTCTGGPPPYEGLDMDFVDVVDNLLKIVRMTGDFPPVTSGFMTREGNDWKINLQHVPFLVSQLPTRHGRSVTNAADLQHKTPGSCSHSRRAFQVDYPLRKFSPPTGTLQK